MWPCSSHSCAQLPEMSGHDSPTIPEFSHFADGSDLAKNSPNLKGGGGGQTDPQEDSSDKIRFPFQTWRRITDQN